MNLQEVFNHHTLRPLAQFGLVDEKWGINIDTLCYTWAAMGIIVITTILFRLTTKINPQNALLTTGEIIYNYFRQSIEENFGFVDQAILEFIVSIFLFTSCCSLVGMIPGLEEATADINTTLAIGSYCFFYAQYQGLRYKKFGYFKKYISPIFIFLPLNIIGQLAKIVSLSFRLFGNVLAGTIILFLVKHVIFQLSSFYFPIITTFLLCLYIIKKWKLQDKHPYINIGLLVAVNLIPIIQMFCGILEGMLQAFIIASITSMYIAAECSENGGH